MENAKIKNKFNNWGDLKIKKSSIKYKNLCKYS